MMTLIPFLTHHHWLIALHSVSCSGTICRETDKENLKPRPVVETLEAEELFAAAPTKPLIYQT